jgi:hypothetical protein
MKTWKFSIFLVGCLILFSCNKKFETTIIEKNINPFDTLVLNDVFEVHLIQGEKNSIRMEGSKKILDNIKLDVQSNSLLIENTFSMGWMYPSKNKVKLYLTFDTLSLIVANETCQIISDNTLKSNELGLILKSKLNHAKLNIDCNSFYYWNNFPCGGTIELSGKSKELKLWNVALMAIDAKNLDSEVVTIQNASKGNISVNCTSKLHYSILGEGNIYLFGNPSIVIAESLTGKGKLIPQ